MTNGNRFTSTIILVFVAIVTFPSISSIEEIKTFTINSNGHGKYSFEYETSGGTYRREEGGIDSNSDGNYLAVRGEYGYIGTSTAFNQNPATTTSDTTIEE